MSSLCLGLGTCEGVVGTWGHGNEYGNGGRPTVTGDRPGRTSRVGRTSSGSGAVVCRREVDSRTRGVTGKFQKPLGGFRPDQYKEMWSYRVLEGRRTESRVVYLPRPFTSIYLPWLPGLFYFCRRDDDS